MKTPELEIETCCPKCQAKALYIANKRAPTYKIQPSRKGKLSCKNCGYINSNFEFSEENYYYKIEIKNRLLYARNLEGLLFIKQYFEGDAKMYSDPDLDYPKVFYENRKEIVRKIEQLLKS